MNTKNFKKSAQSGFTLVELIIVIVILGILAAVAIPKLSDTSTAAYAGVETATVGALKSAWSAAYAKNKGVLPTPADIASQMSDPVCLSAGGKITCGASIVAGAIVNPITKDGSTASVFNTGAAEGTTVASPSSINAN